MSSILSDFCRNYEHYYFVKTHMVQVPLPIYVRKRSPSQIRNRPIAKVSLTNATDDTTKPLERRAKCLAFNEETLAAIRMSFTRRTQSQFKKSRKVSYLFIYFIKSRLNQERLALKFPSRKKKPNQTKVIHSSFA